MPTGRILCALVATALMSGCGSTRIFYATFESDTVGALPNTSPPESPTGDTIYVSDVGGAGASQLAVTGSNPIGGTKSLRYANVDTPVFNRFVGFMGKEIAPDADADLFAYWNGRMQGTGSALQIWLGDGHFRTLGRIVFEDGTVRRQVTGGATPTYESIGSYNEGGEHFVLISVDGDARTWRVSVIQSGAPNVASGPHAVLDTAALGATRPTLYLWFGDAASGSATYVIDDAVISHRPPGE